MKSKFTYEVRLGFETGAIIGWRKTLKQAFKFAETIIDLYGRVVIVKRERQSSDFGY